MPRLNLIVEAMAKCAFPSKECAIGRMIAEIGKLLFSRLGPIRAKLSDSKSSETTFVFLHKD